MTRRLLYLSGLPPKFWADALLHSVYLYNRSVNSAIGMTPQEAHTGVKPDLSRLRVFGSRVLCKVLGKRTAKIDHHIYKGIFIGYGATDKHIGYIDSITSREKTATHAVFNEAHYTSTTRPPGPQLLYSLGMPKESKQQQIYTNPDIHPRKKSRYPSLGHTIPQNVRQASNTPLPINEYTIPQQIAASAAKVDYIRKQDNVHTISFSSSTLCST